MCVLSAPPHHADQPTKLSRVLFVCFIQRGGDCFGKEDDRSQALAMTVVQVTRETSLFFLRYVNDVALQLIEITHVLKHNKRTRLAAGGHDSRGNKHFN